MDIKNLIQKLDGITDRQFLTENVNKNVNESSSGGASSAGGFATVEGGIGGSTGGNLGIQRRIPKITSKKDVKKDTKKAVKEDEINEEDLLVNPLSAKPKAGFVPRSQVRTDHEVSMAISDLLQCGKNAEIVYNILQGISEEQGLPGWVQEKITKAGDYLNTVAEYMEGEYRQSIQQNTQQNVLQNGYGVIAGGTTMEESYTRWDGIGFDIRSDHLWPAYVMETKNLFENSNISSWLHDQRENQREPKKGTQCILAMVVYTGKEILVIHGEAQYVGQTPTHYILKNNTGTHQYSKTDQIVFDSEQSFGVFTTTMALKFADSNTNIDIRHQNVMEASSPAQQAAIAVNMKKQGKKPKVTERAKSKQQQKFFGMVHAMQKGEKVKGASPELKKAAKSISKGDVKDFASTKHKKLPTKVDEASQYEDSLLRSLDESMTNLMGSILNEDPSTKMFLETGEDEGGKPHIRKYLKKRSDGSKATRWEVLDYHGERASGQGSEGFDNLKSAKEFLAKNKKKLSAPPDTGNEEVNENLRDWFKEKWVRFNPQGKIMGPCARGDDSEGKPKCLPQSKAQNLGKKGRASAAAKKRREDPNPERSGKAINVATKTRKKSNEGVDEGERKLDELKCWSGYSRVQGVPAGAPGSCKKKTKEDVEVHHHQCPECGGPAYDDEMLAEEKDACYTKVKSRYKVWPSAYASGALSKCRKVGAKNWGNKSKK